MNNIFSNLNLFAHYLVQEILKPGDWAIDATAGNGKDTLFLAKTVTNSGQVFAFDIQDQALEMTRNLLVANNALTGVQLIKSGHENMESIISGKVKAVMFNLGYLPGGDHEVITKPETTLAGIRQALNLLDQGGIITITIYSAHEGGKEEKEAVEELVENLDSRKWNVLKWSFLNKSTNAPFIVVIYRKEEG
ncbi:MAG: methyltransferase domain-containing protein [Clostridia bacterium]|mgnify:FL=1|nr:methyltransferase domain-containing protein [Clostridia bacterium]